MDGALWFAKELKGRNNPASYSPVFGKIESLAPLQVRLSDEITRDERNLASIIDLYERDSDGNYIYLGKEAVLLPYGDGQQYIVIGIKQ